MTMSHIEQHEELYQLALRRERLANLLFFRMSTEHRWYRRLYAALEAARAEHNILHTRLNGPELEGEDG